MPGPFEYAEHFGHRMRHIGQMFDHLKADDRVEAIAIKR